MSSIFKNDIAIDLGSSNILVYVSGKGVVLREPSLVAIQGTKGKKRVVAFGQEARSMVGKTPPNIEVLRPLKDGVVNDVAVTEALLRHYLKLAQPKFKLRKPRLIITVPSGISDVESRAVKEAAEFAGARAVYLIEEPVAAALGAGIKITDATGSLIVSIGGALTEIAVLSLGSVIVADSSEIAGDRFNDDIIQFLSTRHEMYIGESSAEDLKIGIGAAFLTGDKGLTMEVKGRDLASGAPKMVTLSSSDVRDSILEALQEFTLAVRKVLERTPPELAGDIVDTGIVLTGGGALLKGIDILLREEIGVPVSIADRPIEATVLGAGIALEHLVIYQGKVVR